MLVLGTLVLAAASNVNVELEVGGGFAHSLEGSPECTGGYAFATPALQSRIAVDYSDLLSFGATFVSSEESVGPASALPSASPDVHWRSAFTSPRGR